MFRCTSLAMAAPLSLLVADDEEQNLGEFWRRSYSATICARCMREMQMRHLFNDAYRSLDWPLTLPTLQVKIIMVVNVFAAQTDR